MTANQRRSGFRLPWVAEDDDPGAQPPPAAESGSVNPPDAGPAPTGTRAPAAGTNGSTPSAADTNAAAPAGEAAPAAEAEPPQSSAATPHSLQARTAEARNASDVPNAPAAAPEPPGEFMRDLIAAMRTVADEARESGVTKLKVDADEAVRRLEADAERRRQELRERADADVNGVGEWARAEAERIKAEAEQRVAARRTQLEQQIAAEGSRTEAETKAVRSRVEDYERELEAFHAQLNEINDPAAFAAAAKRMPRAPELTPTAASSLLPKSAQATSPSAAAPASAGGNEPIATGEKPAAPEATPDEVHPAEEEVLAARLAALDEKLDASPAPASAPASTSTPAARAPVAAAATAAAAGTDTTTDIVVKGLGSFGAITGFRQSLSGQAGISAVALSLGQTGEFVFRATHGTGFDVAGAISAMEGDNATVEPRPEGGLRVTLERSR